LTPSGRRSQKLEAVPRELSTCGAALLAASRTTFSAADRFSVEMMRFALSSALRVALAQRLSPAGAGWAVAEGGVSRRGAEEAPLPAGRLAARHAPRTWRRSGAKGWLCSGGGAAG
jgi:hypothetical protein